MKHGRVPSGALFIVTPRVLLIGWRRSSIIDFPIFPARSNSTVLILNVSCCEALLWETTGFCFRIPPWFKPFLSHPHGIPISRGLGIIQNRLDFSWPFNLARDICCKRSWFELYWTWVSIWLFIIRLSLTLSSFDLTKFLTFFSQINYPLESPL